MAVIVTTAARLQIVQWGVTDRNGWMIYRAYSNNYTPSPSSIVSNFVEKNFNANKILRFAPAQIMSSQVVGVSEPMVFSNWETPFTPFTMYGYYVTWTNADVLVFAERFDTPVSITASDQTVTKTMTVVLS